MEIGLVGLPGVGKTTIFNLLTSAQAEVSKFGGKAETNQAMARVPDERIDFLAQLYRPRRTTYAQIKFTDIPGLVHGGTTAFLNAVREVDALVYVLRAFRDADGLAEEGPPLRQFSDINYELLLADLELVEKRIQKITEGRKVTKEQGAELEVLRLCRDFLEQGSSLHQIPLTAEQRLTLRHYAFLTDRPVVLVCNVDEEQFRQKSYPDRDLLLKEAGERGLPLVEVCGQLEMEISQLSEEDRQVFMADLGLQETGIQRLACAVYHHLGLISFLTAGEDEVKAWTIKAGTTARTAAGKIHSDIERGFIRAEVVSFNDLFSLGSMAKVREKGLLRLEGKDYVVQDGDIINFRFNI